MALDANQKKKQKQIDQKWSMHWVQSETLNKSKHLPIILNLFVLENNKITINNIHIQHINVYRAF